MFEPYCGTSHGNRTLRRSTYPIDRNSQSRRPFFGRALPTLLWPPRQGRTRTTPCSPELAGAAPMSSWFSAKCGTPRQPSQPRAAECPNVRTTLYIARVAHPDADPRRDPEGAEHAASQPDSLVRPPSQTKHRAPLHASRLTECRSPSASWECRTRSQSVLKSVEVVSTLVRKPPLQP